MNLLEDFIILQEEKLKLADDYERSQSFEMAYISLWSVTEHTVKEVETVRKTKELKDKVSAWHYFLDGKTNRKRPQPIKSFVCEGKSIPDIELIKKSLGEVPAIAKLLNTQAKSGSTKYRDKRNAIAHQADKFRSFSVYEDYKETALSAISELKARLKVMEND